MNTKHILKIGGVLLVIGAVLIAGIFRPTETFLTFALIVVALDLYRT